MIKRFLVTAGVLALVAAMPALGRNLTDPEEIVAKAREAYLALENYSFILNADGWELNVAEYKAKNVAMAGEVASSYADVGGDEAADAVKDVTAGADEPQRMGYAIEIRHIKPFDIWMRVLFSDYVPDIMKNSILVHRHSRDPDSFTVTIESLGLPVTRAWDTESGNLFTSNWNIAYMTQDFAMSVADPVFEGVKTVEVEDLNIKRDAYAVSFEFDEDVKLGGFTPDFEAYGVPERFHSILIDDLKHIEEDNPGKITYYFAVDNLLMIRRESFMRDSGEQLLVRDYVNIRTDYLEPDVHFRPRR